MRNAGLEETQAGIKIAWRNINNLRYADDVLQTYEKYAQMVSELVGFGLSGAIRIGNEKHIEDASCHQIGKRCIFEIQLVQLIFAEHILPFL